MDKGKHKGSWGKLKLRCFCIPIPVLADSIPSTAPSLKIKSITSKITSFILKSMLPTCEDMILTEGAETSKPDSIPIQLLSVYTM